MDGLKTNITTKGNKASLIKTNRNSSSKDETKHPYDRRSHKKSGEGNLKLQTSKRDFEGKKGVLQTAKKVSSEVEGMTNQNRVKAGANTVKTAVKASATTAKVNTKVANWSLKKFLSNRVEKTNGKKKLNWSRRQEKYLNNEKRFNKANNAIKTPVKAVNKYYKAGKKFAKNATNEDRVKGVTNYGKDIGKVATKPIRKRVKKVAKEVVKKVTARVVKTLGALLKNVMVLLIKFFPVFAGILVILLILVSITSVFGGISTDGSTSQELIENVEDVFTEIQDKKTSELDAFEQKIQAKIKSQTPPTKDMFEGISDEDFKQVLEKQWHQDCLVRNGVSFIDYRALAVITQYKFTNDTGKLKEFINQLDQRGLIETYSEIDIPVEYEIEWIKWETKTTTHTVSAKTQEEADEEALKLYNSLEVKENTEYEVVASKPEKNKSTLTVTTKTGTPMKEKFTYKQYYVHIENGTFNDFISVYNELHPQPNLDEISKKQENSLLEFSYSNETFMSTFSKKWDVGSGFTTAGGQYVSGVPNGKLINWKGGIDDFADSQFASNPDLIGQCTWFASGRWSKTHKQHCPLSTNAGYFFSEAINLGMSVGKVPKPHSIIVMSGGTGEYAGCGHVAFIEEIKMEGGKISSLVISQGNVGGVPQQVVMRQPIQSTDVREYKSIEEYMSIWGAGLSLEGYVY